ncbi:hypothetical protein RCL1_001910 [Eukaryota sp. TZLM3-RCL]
MSLRSPPFLVLHQHVSLSLDFSSRSLHGTTTITAVPTGTKTDIFDGKPVLFLNAQNLQIHNISVNDIPCGFLQTSPASVLTPFESSNRIDFHTISKAFSQHVQSESTAVELIAFLPPPSDFSFASLSKQVAFTLKLSRKKSVTKEKSSRYKSADFNSFSIKIDFSQPNSNLFHSDASPIFTISPQNSAAGTARAWIPCLDHESVRNSWTFDITCQSNLIAVCPGVLTNSVVNSELATYSYSQLLPCSASTIGVIVTELISSKIEGNPLTQSIGFEIFSMNQSSVYSFSGVKSTITPIYFNSTLNHFRNILSNILSSVSAFFPRILEISPKLSIVFCSVCPDSGAWGSGLILLPLSLLIPSSLCSRWTANYATIVRAIVSCFVDTVFSTTSVLDHWVQVLLAAILFTKIMPDLITTAEYNLLHLSYRRQVFQLDKTPLQTPIAPPLHTLESVQGDVFLASCIKELKDMGRFELPATRSTEFHWKKAVIVARHLSRMTTDPVNLVSSFLSESCLEIFDWAEVRSKSGTDANIPFHSLSTTDNRLKCVTSEGEFKDLLRTNTNIDVQSFLKLWIYSNGMAELHFKFWYNRRRILTELALKQTVRYGINPFSGKVSVSVVEPGGTFQKDVTVPLGYDKDSGAPSTLILFEIKFKMRNRRPRKRQAFNDLGELLDINGKTPVLSVICDAEVEVPGLVTTSQHSYMWKSLLDSAIKSNNIETALHAINGYLHENSNSAAYTVNQVAATTGYDYLLRRAGVRCLAAMTIPLAHSLLISIARSVLLDENGSPVPLPSPKFASEVEFFTDLAECLGLIKTPSVAIFDLVIEILHNYSDDTSAADSSTYLSLCLLTATSHVTSEDQAQVVHEIINHTLQNQAILPCFNHVLSVKCLECTTTLITKGYLVLTQRFCHSLIASSACSQVPRVLRITALRCLVSLCHYIHSNPSSYPYNLEFSSLKHRLHPFSIVPFIISLGSSDEDKWFGVRALGTLLLPPPALHIPSSFSESYPLTLDVPPPPYTPPKFSDAFSVFRQSNSKHPAVRQLPQTLWSLLALPNTMLDSSIRHVLHAVWLRFYGYATPPCLFDNVTLASSADHQIFSAYTIGIDSNRMVS